MRTALYVAWLILPSVLFLMALWGLLEKVSDKHKRARPGELFKQGLFVLACVVVAVAVDQYALEQLAEVLNSEWLPLAFLQIILLPAVLLVGAKLLGPSKKILIGEAKKGAGHRKR